MRFLNFVTTVLLSPNQSLLLFLLNFPWETHATLQVMSIIPFSAPFTSSTCRNLFHSILTLLVLLPTEREVLHYF
jgi:hypothetical protein